MFEVTQENFLKDVKDHSMTIEREDGIYRNLYFGEGGSFHQHFRIVTFADYLVYTGDMGTFIFKRTADMFTFFRGKAINPRYWAEKLEASDRDGSYQEYDYLTLRESLINYTKHNGWDKDEEDKFKSWLDCREDEPKHWVVEKIYHSDFDLEDYLTDGFDAYKFTTRYMWACYAIVWAIGIYDEHKKS